MIAVPAEWETLYAKYFHIPVTDLIQYPNPYFALPLYTAVAVYIALIFGIPVVFRKMGWKGLQNNEAFRILLIIWNGCLSIFSLAAFLGSTIPYAQFVQKYGFMNILCDESGILLNYRETGIFVWGLIFCWSKYLELFDTLFLVLKKPERKVLFLHWFHHVTVLLFSWYCIYWRFSVGILFVIMNSFIHTIMYYYYFRKEINHKYNPWWAILLTLAQISQMFLGIVFNGLWAYKWFKGDTCYCLDPWTMMAACAGMYGTYLYLFCSFFYKRYISKEKVKDE